MNIHKNMIKIVNTPEINGNPTYVTDYDFKHELYLCVNNDKIKFMPVINLATFFLATTTTTEALYEDAAGVMIPMQEVETMFITKDDLSVVIEFACDGESDEISYDVFIDLNKKEVLFFFMTP